MIVLMLVFSSKCQSLLWSSHCSFYNIDPAILIDLQIVFVKRAILWGQNEQLSSDTISSRGKNITLLPENVLLMLLLTPYITIIESDRGQNNFSNVNYFFSLYVLKAFTFVIAWATFCHRKNSFCFANEK